MATVLLFIAAFAFYLLQDPYAPLPFSHPPDTSTSTSLPPSLTSTTIPSATPSPTKQTSYTPFATLLTLTPITETPSAEMTSQVPTQSETVTPEETVTPLPPTNTSPVIPSATFSGTQIPASPSATTSPTVTETLSTGEHGVTGRVVQNATPVANVIVEFEDDTPSRQSTTDSTGHYWFTTLAPGTSFILSFNQSDNPHLSPADEVTSFAWFEGSLPTGVDIIDFPDFEVSLNLNGMIFDLQSPANDATYSAAAITTSNPVQFVWSLYGQGGSYHIELVSEDTDELVWSSDQLINTSFMWDGTLNDGTHVSEGTYSWRIAVTRSAGNYVAVVFTQPWELVFNP